MQEIFTSDQIDKSYHSSGSKISYTYGRVFLEGSKLLYKIWAPKWFFKRIYKSASIRVFFNYWRNYLLNQIWYSEI